MESIICFVDFSLFFLVRILYIYLFSNHLSGQDTLHIDVYDEDSLKDEKIGSFKIDLRDLYDKGFYSRSI